MVIPMQVAIFEDVQGAIILICQYLLALAIMIGCAIWSHFRRKKISTNRFFILGAIAIAYIFIIYNATFAKYFFMITVVQGNNIEITYKYPSRVKVIEMNKISKLYAHEGNKGMYNLAIESKDGRLFLSAPATKREIDDKLKTLHETLESYVQEPRRSS